MDRIGVCSLCCETYGKSIRPRGLPCGHSFCTDCLQKWIKNGKISCPTCQRNHCVSDATEISINFDLERVLSFLADSEQMNSNPLPYVAGKKIEKLIAEQATSAQEQLILVKDMKSQLSGYDKYLVSSAEEHEVTAQKLQDLASKYVTIAGEMKEERRKIVDTQKETDSSTNVVEAHLQSLETSFDTKAGAGAFVTKLVESVGELDEWMKKCQQQFPNPSFISSREELLIVNALLGEVDSQESNNDALARLHPDGATIMEKIHMNSRKTYLFPDSADKLRERRWLERIGFGQVVAVCSSHGRERSAQLSLKDEKIYLHYLRDAGESSLPFKFKFSDVMNCLNTDAVVAFLDLSWGRSFRGRIHILLSPDTPLARQFKVLCTGELGPSYAHSKFFQATNFGTQNEDIRGGDYENNSGSGGKAVVDGINVNASIYKRQNEHGIVWALSKDVCEKGAQFVIGVGPGNSRTYESVFGKVQDGFSVLKDASVQMQMTKDVEISDCGIVLPL